MQRIGEINAGGILKNGFGLLTRNPVLGIVFNVIAVIPLELNPHGSPLLYMPFYTKSTAAQLPDLRVSSTF